MLFRENETGTIMTSRSRVLVAVCLVIALLLGYAAGYLTRDHATTSEINSLSRDITLRDASRHLSLQKLLVAEQYDSAQRTVSDYLYGDLVAMQVLLESGAVARFNDTCSLADQIASFNQQAAPVKEKGGDATRMRERLTELRKACLDRVRKS
jgi:hypothetical protein